MQISRIKFSNPSDVERIEVGQSVDDSQPLNDDLTSNSNQVQQQPSEDILNDNDNFRGEPADHGMYEIFIKCTDLKI